MSEFDLTALFARDGFALYENAITTEIADHLTSILQVVANAQSDSSAGIRRLLETCPEIRDFAKTEGAVLASLALLNQVSGNAAERNEAAGIATSAPFPVRAILFDKSAGVNWYVTWHQDRTIPVTARIDTAGFTAWSVKDHVLHVQPPASILESMVAVRIHLDDCAADNGAIKFVPGSHTRGLLDADVIASEDNSARAVTVPAKRGDVIFMRPLILHASSKSTLPKNRRVLHIEYANCPLPNGLEWAMA